MVFAFISERNLVVLKGGKLIGKSQEKARK